MKNFSLKIGIGSSILIIVACLFKAFHWPGAGMLLSSGFLLFSFGFVPLLIVSLLKQKKIIESIAALFMSAITLGVLFKIMRWPYADFLITWIVTLSLFGLSPLYFFKTYSTKINDKFTLKDRNKRILVAVFILTILSLWFAMIDLSRDPSPFTFY